MRVETAGDPITGLKWTRKTTEKLADELCCHGFAVGERTVARILKSLDYSLKVNHKQLSRTSKVPREERDAQFKLIDELKIEAEQQGYPVISVDTKKRELIGCFKNDGSRWERDATEVKDHDFRSEAEGIAIPYGIYDVNANVGAMYLGTSADTPQFAVENIERWWLEEGRISYPKADRITILADAGGSNSATSRMWKVYLHDILCKKHGLEVTVAHYPSGASKWNPIEHRMFSFISKNWSGCPLTSYELMTNYITTTMTKMGLTVRASLVDVAYEKGQKVSPKDFDALPITKHEALPKWTYTVKAA